MKKKINKTYFLKLISLAVIWAMALPYTALAQTKIFDKQTLSPALHIPLNSFLESYGRAYRNTKSSIDKDYFSPENQKQRIQKFKEEIIENVRKYSKDFKHDQRILNTFLELADKNYKDKKFPDSPNEYYFHHCLTVALDLSQRQAPIESICTALLHRFDENKIDELLKQANISELLAQEIRHLYYKLMYILKFNYAEMPFAGGKHDLQNFMNFIIQQCEKEENGERVADERVLILVLSDMLASVRASSEKKRDSLVKEIEELWAYLAHRSGLEDMKNDLLDEHFEYSLPAAHQEIRSLIEKRFNMPYEKLKEYVENKIEPMIWDRIKEKYGEEQDKITEVKVRVKGLYEIFEKMQEKGSFDNVNDILGMRIICDCRPENLYEYYDIIQETIFKEMVEFDDERKKELEEELPAAGPSGVIYMDFIAKDGYQYEAQILTKEFNEKREINRPHWSYKAQSKTKQKFDQAERYIVTGNPKNDFARIFDALKSWVIIFVIKEEKGKIEILPKRMPKGAIVADVAALRGVNLLNDKFSGAKLYQWQRNEPIRPFKVDVDYVLEPGDMLKIENESFLKGKFSRISRKAKTLRAQLMLNLTELRKQINKDSFFSAEPILKEDMQQYGVNTNIGSAFEKYINNFANSKGLDNAKELYALFTHCPSNSQDLRIDTVFKEVETEGKRIVKEVFEGLKNRELNNFALGQLALQFGIMSPENFYVQIGVGQITVDDLVQRLSGVSKMPEGMLDISINKKYKVNIELALKNTIGKGKINAIITKIETLLDKYNLKKKEERIEWPQFFKRSNELHINFFAKTNDSEKIKKFENELKKIAELNDNKIIKEKQINCEEFLDKKNKQRKWEIRIQFPLTVTDEDIWEFASSFDGIVKTWGQDQKTRLGSCEPVRHENEKGEEVLEAVAEITTNLTYSTIINNFNQMKDNNPFITETSAETIYSHQDSFSTHEAALINSAI